MLVASQHGPCNHEANNPEDEACQHSSHRVFALALKQHDAADDPDNLREDVEQQKGDTAYLCAATHPCWRSLFSKWASNESRPEAGLPGGGTRRSPEVRKPRPAPETLNRPGPPRKEGARGGTRGSPAVAYIIPPMSGMPAPAPTGFFSGGSATIASVVRMFFAIDAAFCSAERVTMVGSMIPALTRSSYSPVATFRPWPAGSERILSTTTEPSRPALSASWRIGSSSARVTMYAPVRSSPESPSLIAPIAFRSATPPPGTMPSSRAARVACSASSTRCFFSFISVSVAAPTLTTATPPASFARRSLSFSRSKSESVFSISAFSCLI